jgi:hypothetical protein
VNREKERDVETIREKERVGRRDDYREMKR